MDTTYLLKREQVSLMMAKKAASAEARLAHAGLARGYGALLAAQLPYRQVRTRRAPRPDASKNPNRGNTDA